MSLRQALKEDKHEDLSKACKRLKAFVEEWWEAPHLQWFTDHGANHSQRVAAYARKIATPPHIAKNFELTALELFILEAASWLHDIGMQNLLEAGALGSINDAGYADVRHQHPDRSAHEILNHGHELGLPKEDTALWTVIAYVARAHGTNYYHDSLAVLREWPKVRNETVRGPLLAAILLMADELDLHYQRAKPIPGKAYLNHVSEAHAIKHKCVISTDLEHGFDGTISILLTLSRPPTMSDEHFDEIQKWITVKLQKQIALTESQIHEGFGGQVRFSRSILVSRVHQQVPVPSPSDEAMSVIIAENRRDDLIDHDTAFLAAKEAITLGHTLILAGNLIGPYGDEDGREDLMDALCAHFLAQNRIILRSTCLYESGGIGDLTDVIEEWLHTNDFTAKAESAEGAHFDRLCAAVGAANSPIVATITAFDLLPKADRDWFAAVLVPALIELGDVTFILSTEPTYAVGTITTPMVAIPTMELDRQEMGRHLARYSPASSLVGVVRSAVPYRVIRELRDGNILALAEEAQ